MSLGQCGAACAPNHGSTEGSQAHRAMWIARNVDVRHCAIFRTHCDHHFCDSNLQPSGITFCYHCFCFAEECCVISPCWKKKNGVAKMRQAGTAPATGATVHCLTSLWCTVTHKRCSVMDTTNSVFHILLIISYFLLLSLLCCQPEPKGSCHSSF